MTNREIIILLLMIYNIYLTYYTFYAVREQSAVRGRDYYIGGKHGRNSMYLDDV